MKFANQRHNHVLIGCGMTGWRLRRHNGLARSVAQPFFKDMGWDWDETAVQTSLATRRTASTPSAATRRASSQTHGCRRNGGRTGAPGRRGGCHRRAPHDQGPREDQGAPSAHHAIKCGALNYDFVPAAFTSFGGWGVTLLAMLQAEYHAKKEEEKKSGGSGWKAQHWKQD